MRALPSRQALARLDLADLDGLLERSQRLPTGILALHADLMPQRQDDGADHRDEEDESGALEEIYVSRVEDGAERLRVGDRGIDRDTGPAKELRREHPGRDHQQELGEHDDS